MSVTGGITEISGFPHTHSVNKWYFTPQLICARNMISEDYLFRLTYRVIDSPVTVVHGFPYRKTTVTSLTHTYSSNASFHWHLYVHFIYARCSLYTNPVIVVSVMQKRYVFCFVLQNHQISNTSCWYFRTFVHGFLSVIPK